MKMQSPASVASLSQFSTPVAPASGIQAPRDNPASGLYCGVRAVTRSLCPPQDHVPSVRPVADEALQLCPRLDRRSPEGHTRDGVSREPAADVLIADEVRIPGCRGRRPADPVLHLCRRRRKLQTTAEVSRRVPEIVDVEIELPCLIRP